MRAGRGTEHPHSLWAHPSGAPVGSLPQKLPGHAVPGFHTGFPWSEDGAESSKHTHVTPPTAALLQHGFGLTV